MSAARRDDLRIERNGEVRTRSEAQRTYAALDEPGDLVVDEHSVDERSVRYTQFNAATVNGVLGILLIALEGLLLTRFTLLAFGASTRSGFVRFIYDVSHPFIRPFDNAFANRTWDQGIIEPATLLAMGVYVLLFGVAMMLISAVMPQMAERRGVETRHIRRV